MSQSCSASLKHFISSRFRKLFANKFKNAEENMEVEPAENNIEQAAEVDVEEKCVSGLSKTKNRSYTIEDFHLIRVIGRGGFAKVYVAELKSSKELYALKVMKKTMIATSNGRLEWIHTEKRVYESAGSHPFLVGLHSCFQTATRLFFVIEFVRGGDLATLMSNRRQLPENQVIFYAAEIALALNFLHNIGEYFFNIFHHIKVSFPPIPTSILKIKFIKFIYRFNNFLSFGFCVATIKVLKNSAKQA